MTREEKIDWLCRLRACLNNGEIFTPWNKEFTEALNDVLEQEPKTMVEIDLYSVIKQKYIERVVFDKIKAEIKEWYWQVDKQALAKDPCVVDAMIDLFIRTINKYKAETEEKK